MRCGKELKNKERKEDTMSDIMPENKQYLEYIKEHKKNVTKAFAIYGKLMIDIMYDDNTDKLSIWERLYEKINDTHDDSKYEEEEFEAYRRKLIKKEEEMCFISSSVCIIFNNLLNQDIPARQGLLSLQL